jgi:hypothetical protein
MMSLVLRSFEHYVAIDWSGARGARQKGIALAIASADHAPKLIRPGHIWSRQEVLDWLHDQAANKSDMLIGFDFSTGLAFHDQGAYFPHWPESPDRITKLWALVDHISQHDPDLLAASFLAHPEAQRHFRHGGGIVGDLFGQGGGRLRFVEQYQRRTGQSASVSNFNLVGAAQVGKASLTGMRLLHRIHSHIPLWPLDPIPKSGPLIVEIYTALAARAAQIPKGRSKIRDLTTLQQALRHLNSVEIQDFGPITDHQSDALLSAAWMRQIAASGQYWQPKLLTDKIAAQEGWTFGII